MLPERSSRRSVDGAWLAEQNACGPDFDLIRHEFGEGVIDLSPANYERAVARGINVLWAGVRLLDEDGRKDVIGLAIRERAEALRDILGEPPPSMAALPAAIGRAREDWKRTLDDEIRKRLMVLKDLDSDLRAKVVDPAAVDLVIRHLLRAVSSAGLDEEPVRERIRAYMVQLIGIGAK